MNLLPILRRTPHGFAQLFWRYKAYAQRAARDGDYKFLKILDNSFSSTWLRPLERANLRNAKRTLSTACREWYEWNNSMLPEDQGELHRELRWPAACDHFGARNRIRADIPVSRQMTRESGKHSCILFARPRGKAE